MNETPKKSSAPLVIAIVIAIAGLASAGFLASKSSGLQKKLDGTTQELSGAAQELKNRQTTLDDTIKKLQQTESELTQTKASLASKEIRLTEVSQQLDQNKNDLNQAKTEIARMEPLAAKARQMPITTSFSKAILGSGLVLSLQNKTTKSLALNVAVADANSQKTKEFRVVLDGGASLGGGFSPSPIYKIGYAEGWAFASGDTFEITCAGYDSIKNVVP